MSWVAALVLLHTVGCGGGSEVASLDSTTAAPPLPAPVERDGGADSAITAVDEAVAGDPRALIALLERPHAVAREGLGPHRLEATTHLRLAPTRAQPALPAVDERHSPAREVHDRLELVWAGSGPDDAPRFELHQANEHDRGRDVVALDGRVYTRLPHRPWLVRDLDTDVHERWLDDAYRSVGDVIALAGPRLAVRRDEDRPRGDRRGLVLSLSLADAPVSVPPPPHPRAAWRANAEISDIQGELVVDADTGAWLNADLKVAFSVAASYDPSVRLEGKIELLAGLAPAGRNLTIEAPSDPLPYPERRRMDLERDELLDGLATP